METLFVFLGLLCSFFEAPCNQDKSKQEIIIAHAWKLETHTMSGVGSHSSIPNGTVIEFLADQTWKSSEPIENFKTGKWSLKNNERTLSMIFGDTEREYLIQSLTNDKLRYRFSKLGAVLTFEWIAKQNK